MNILFFVKIQNETNRSAQLLYVNKDNDETWVKVKEDIKSRTDRFNEEIHRWKTCVRILQQTPQQLQKVKAQ